MHHADSCLPLQDLYQTDATALHAQQQDLMTLRLRSPSHTSHSPDTSKHFTPRQRSLHPGDLSFDQQRPPGPHIKGTARPSASDASCRLACRRGSGALKTDLTAGTWPIQEAQVGACMLPQPPEPGPWPCPGPSERAGAQGLGFFQGLP